MKKYLIAAALSFLAATAHAAPETYTFDKEHTTVLFYINHLGYSDKIGQFRDYDGTLTLDRDKPENSSVEVTFKIAGVDSGSKLLDEHLQNEKWFNAAKFPEAKFKSTKVTVTGKNTADVTGNLALLGQEKPVTLKVVFHKAEAFPMDNTRFVAGFSARTSFKRSDWGMKEGIPYVGDEVRIVIETETIRKDEPAKP
ncbi:MAG: polyisoprenoid-binding protein [Alphaproteobacteria bacterium]|nr:polyisoprenoid-binding protein [Alphaproteobacteria bacterium]